MNKEEQIFSPGFDGLPFRGTQPPALKKDDKAQPVEVRDAKIKVFDLNKEEDLAEYQRVSDLVAKGLALISLEKVQWNSETNGWTVLLRWLERFMQMPGQLERRVSYDPSRGLNIK